MRRFAFGLLLTAALVVLPATAIYAQSYQLDSLSTTTPTPGQTLHAHGNGFAPGSTVAVVATCGSTKATIGSLTASDPGGVVDGDVVLPPSTPTGSCSIDLVGTNPDGSARALGFDVTVAGEQAVASSGALPFTGGAVAPLVAAGIGLLIVGATVVASVRRQRMRAA